MNHLSQIIKVLDCGHYRGINRGGIKDLKILEELDAYDNPIFHANYNK